ncbi:shikimate dehydrogenase [Anaeromicrobium sediminis]|uniref:Shikimate dehydrogenase (NADP(+)) n=1 Tax=Anaeromicrobium sediminis TaxID=1478221 RepID=A0A267MHP1_9FIRM|nr:shikimate dehydrogenase [Anaeromicrobium sediminis]PAB58448.1 shikimate dehydrogenase [Anaeromicrobium sediminis]
MNHRIKGSTKLYAVIGDPINHSLSPELHNTLFDYEEKDSAYIPLKIRYEELGANIHTLRNNLYGFNITKPHKQNIIKYLDQMDENSKVYNAVNTVKVESGKLMGYNTDGYGFSKSIEHLDLEEKKVLLLGAGGAASVVLYELLKKGACVHVKNRSRNKAEDMVENIIKFSSNKDIHICDEINDSYYMIVNSTPLGMGEYKGVMPIDEIHLENVKVAYDLIYNPYHTEFLKRAKEKGAQVINGFEMLFYQGIRAQEIWKNEKINEELVMKVYKDINKYFEDKFRD